MWIGVGMSSDVLASLFLCVWLIHTQLRGNEDSVVTCADQIPRVNDVSLVQEQAQNDDNETMIMR